jgi:DNA-directed RNA polymerase subunit L
MSIKIKNMSVNEITYNKKTFKDFDKCVEYVKSIKPNYKQYLPSKSQYRVQFEITNTVSDFANCIRRFLLDEIDVYSMNVCEDDVISDDVFILSDVLKKRIELVPFQQKLNDINDLIISLTVENKTDDLMTIYTRHINITDKKNKQLNPENYFSTNIPIIQLRSNKSLDIKNINITKGCGKKDAGKFCLLANLSYEIMDVTPFEESKYEKKGESSLNSTPQHFKIGYTTHRNIEPKKIMLLCCDGITKRLTDILSEMSNIKNDMNVYFSDLIDLESKGDVKLFHFKGEYWTIANIIARYCFLEFKEIKFVCACIIHPSTEESIVKIRHSESVKIITSAIKHILADIAIVRKAF